MYDFNSVKSLSRQLAEAGAHVVMAVRKPDIAQDLIQKWQYEWSGMGLPLNIEVTGVRFLLLLLDLILLGSSIILTYIYMFCVLI